MDDRPVNFSIVWSGTTAHVKRNFEFDGLGSVSIDFKINMSTGRESTITDIHQASVSIAAHELLALLPADFHGGPFVPGPRKKTQ